MERDPFWVGALKELKSFTLAGRNHAKSQRRESVIWFPPKKQAEVDALDCVMFESLSLAPREISWTCNWCKPKLDEGTRQMLKIGEWAKLWKGWAEFPLWGNFPPSGTWDSDQEGTDLLWHNWSVFSEYNYIFYSFKQNQNKIVPTTPLVKCVSG